MEYDPAFPTEDNDEEIDHIIDVTDIPLPVTKKKNKRTKLMKIPLPDDKADVIKPLVETSNSPPQEPDTSWLQPTSTQVPLKFNIMKSNTMKPTDEENNVFDDLELKAEPAKLPKLLPKKSKPITLPTGVIVKNADFVVNEPKTNTELFLPPKITSIESNTLSNATIDMANISYGNSVTNPNMIAVLNNQNLINSYPLMNMSYIIPQKLRSAQMISQPLVANPAIASLNQKKAQETNSKTESRKRSRSSSRGRSTSPKSRVGKQSKSKSPKPRIGIQSKSKSPKPRTGRQTKSKSPKPRKGRQSKSKSPKSRISRQSKSKSPKSRIGRQSKSKSPKSRTGKQSKSKSPKPRAGRQLKSKSPKSEKPEPALEDPKQIDLKQSPKKEESPCKSSSSRKSTSHSRSVSQNRARRSNSRDLKPARTRRSNSPRSNQRGPAISPGNRYQSKPRQSSPSRSKPRQRRSPVNATSRRRRSDSRNRRSHSPHRGLPNRTRHSPSPNNRWRRSSRSRSGNRATASSFGNRHDYSYQENSTNRSFNRNQRSGSRDRKEFAWQTDSGDEVANVVQKPSKDCWAAESESGSHSTPVNSIICDKIDIDSVKVDTHKNVDKVDCKVNEIRDKVDRRNDKIDDETNDTDDDEDNDVQEDDIERKIDKTDSKKLSERKVDLDESPDQKIAPEEKIIVSSSNAAVESGLTKLDQDKNADTTVSSTVDETRTSYISDSEQAPVAYDSGRPRTRNQRSMSRGESVEKSSPSKWRRDGTNRDSRRQRSRSNQYYRDMGSSSTNINRGQRYQDSRPVRNYNEDRRWPVHDNRRSFHGDNRPYRNQGSRSRTPPMRHRTGGTGYRGARHNNNAIMGRLSSSSNSETYYHPAGRQERDWRYQDDRRRRRSASWQSGNNEIRSRDNLRRDSMRMKNTRRERRQSHDSSFDSQDNGMMRANRRSQREDLKRRGQNRFYESPDMRSKRKKEIGKGSTSRQRNHSSSFEEKEEVRIKKKSKNSVRVEDSSLHRSKKKRSYTPNDSGREDRGPERVKSKVKASDSLSDVDSDSSIEIKRKNRTKKANKEKKMKKRMKSTEKQDSETSSINSATIPASYQAVRKQKQFERASSSDSEVSSDTIKRKQKTKKSRKI